MSQTEVQADDQTGEKAAAPQTRSCPGSPPSEAPMMAAEPGPDPQPPSGLSPVLPLSLRPDSRGAPEGCGHRSTACGVFPWGLPERTGRETRGTGNREESHGKRRSGSVGNAPGGLVALQTATYCEMTASYVYGGTSRLLPNFHACRPMSLVLALAQQSPIILGRLLSAV